MGDDRLKGYAAIAEHLAGHGTAFDWREETTGVDPRHTLYRLSQRADNPLPIDGPPNMPVTTRVAVDAWVALVRKRANRVPASEQLGLFDDPAE